MIKARSRTRIQKVLKKVTLKSTVGLEIHLFPHKTMYQTVVSKVNLKNSHTF